MKAGYLYHDDFLKHDTGGHVENAGRLKAINRALENSSLKDSIIRLSPRLATDEELKYIHPQEYIESIEEACERGGGWLDGDTFASRESARVARLAAGGAIVAVEAVVKNDFDWVFCALRPPGHHATPNRAMGFCIYNNAAIAARAAQKMGIERVFIFDWDVHHGNGTQDAFYDDPTVFYMSTHQSPLYPGTGRIKEKGTGKGSGYNINIPLPPGCGDEEYLYVIQEIYTPVVTKFDPGLLIVSAGFDGHRDDPLANQNLSTQGFVYIARLLQKAIMNGKANGKIVTVLEGGYNQSRLSESTIEVMQAWYTKTPEDVPVGKTTPAHVKNLVSEIKSTFPEWFSS